MERKVGFEVCCGVFDLRSGIVDPRRVTKFELSCPQMAILQVFLDGFGCGALCSLPNSSFPAILFLFIGVTRLGGVTFEDPPTLMQTSKCSKTTKNTSRRCISAPRNTNLETSLARVALLLLSAVGSDLASRRLAAR